MAFYQFLLISLAITGVASIFQCSDFKQERLAELEDVAKNGDIKMLTTLTFTEYSAIVDGGGCAGQFNGETIKIFTHFAKSLSEKLKKFEKAHKKVLPKYAKDVDGLMKEGGRVGRKSRQALLVESKKLIMAIMGEGAEAGRLNVYSFMDSGENPWKLLAIIFEVSKLQSAHLDELLIEDILMEHMANRPSSNDGIVERILVEGAGPVGLFAAFKMFMAGMSVTIVNNRLDYVRTQLVVFDADWQAHLRYLLGTKFDHLFAGEKPYEDIRRGRGAASVRDFEEIVKNRLTQLSTFVDRKREKHRGRAKTIVGAAFSALVGKKRKAMGEIKLIYGFSAEDLEEPKSENDSHFQAILRERKNPKNHMKIPVDLFICAGGANDRMRDKLFGTQPRKRSLPKSYGNTRLPKQKENGELTIRDTPFILPLQMEEMKEMLDNANFLSTTNDISVPANIREELENFAQKLVDNKELQVFLLIESAAYFSINFITPPPIVELFEQIEGEKKKNEGKGEESLETLKQRILWKWSKAAFDFSYGKAPTIHDGKRPNYQVNIGKNGDAIVGHNPLTMNIDTTSGIFDVIIQTMDKGVIELKKEEKHGRKGAASAIVAVLGDALASPHFFTGTGMSSGRMGVELLFETIKEEQKGGRGIPLKGREKFVSTMNVHLDRVKRTVVKWASKVIEILPEEQEKQ